MAEAPPQKQWHPGCAWKSAAEDRQGCAGNCSSSQQSPHHTNCHYCTCCSRALAMQKRCIELKRLPPHAIFAVWEHSIDINKSSGLFGPQLTECRFCPVPCSCPVPMLRCWHYVLSVKTCSSGVNKGSAASAGERRYTITCCAAAAGASMYMDSAAGFHVQHRHLRCSCAG